MSHYYSLHKTMYQNNLAEQLSMKTSPGSSSWNPDSGRFSQLPPAFIRKPVLPRRPRENCTD